MCQALGIVSGRSASGSIFPTFPSSGDSVSEACLKAHHPAVFRQKGVMEKVVSEGWRPQAPIDFVAPPQLLAPIAADAKRQMGLIKVGEGKMMK